MSTITRGTQGRNTLIKTPVSGMIERKGNPKAVKIVDVKTNTIIDHDLRQLKGDIPIYGEPSSRQS